MATHEDGIFHLGPLGAGQSKQVYFYLDINGDPGDIPTLNETFEVNLYYTNPNLGSEICDYTDTITSVNETIAAVANKVFTTIAGPNPPELGGIMTMSVAGQTGAIGADQIFQLSPATSPDWPANSYTLADTQVQYWYDTVCPDAAGSVPTIPFTHTFNDTLIFTTPGTKNSCYRAIYTFVATGTTAAPTAVTPVNEISSGDKIKHTGAYTTPLEPIQPTTNLIILDKISDPSSLASGGTVTYSIPVENSGAVEVTLDEFRDILPNSVSYIVGSSSFGGTAIFDPIISSQTLTWTGLFRIPPGETKNLIYSVNFPGNIGIFSNEAVGFIGNEQIDTTYDTQDNKPASSTVTVGSAPTISKIFSPNSILVNTATVLTISLENPNNVNLTGAALTDVYPTNIETAQPVTTSNTCGGSLNIAANNISLSDGIIPANGSCSFSVQVTSSSGGTYTNTIPEESLNTDQGLSNTNPASDSLTILEPGLFIEKTVLETSYSIAGEILHYTYTVTNTGNLALSGPFSVADDKANDESCPITNTLAPNNSITCQASYTITQADLDNGVVINHAQASGYYQETLIVSNIDSESVNANQEPGLSISKSIAESNFTAVGDILHYSYLLSNTGNVTLSGPFTVNDDKAINEACPATVSLIPGANITCTATYEVQQSDLDNGTVTNNAQAFGFFNNSQIASNTATETVGADYSPSPIDDFASTF